MELVLDQICTNCKGEDKCDRYCVLHAGRALTDFIERVDTIETKIGDFDYRTNSTKPDLVVSGHQIYDLGSPLWILTPINTTLDQTPKFKSVFNTNPTRLIRMYAEHMGIEQEHIDEIVNKLLLMNKNRLLVLPFKPHLACTVLNESGNKLECELFNIEWTTDKETIRLKAVFTFKSKSGQILKYNIQDYLKNFRLSSMAIKIKGEKQDNSLISITDHGIFRPILIKDKSHSIALDGTYLYMIVNNETKIIGHWNKKDELEIMSGIKSAAVKKIKDNIKLISSHKKYMAPYLLYKPVEIEL